MVKETKTVRVGNVLFTKSGHALHRAISVEKKEGFIALRFALRHLP